MGYQPVDRAGSHLKLRYIHPETGEIRNLTIPMGKEISGDTLRNIAKQCNPFCMPRYTKSTVC
ncbi:MAG: type II toxin-antitoxin system HicA family toxin [Halovenus sp.]